ncbi:hypothetical protein VTL71DRAFT_16242 [Oculimacula yallundae]|uniref:Uncharacterized protein n=1 Tax=Oculimacula yallundae TaxID=86028 RepID=A0ABR4CDV6_9HELO
MRATPTKSYLTVPNRTYQSSSAACVEIPGPEWLIIIRRESMGRMGQDRIISVPSRYAPPPISCVNIFISSCVLPFHSLRSIIPALQYPDNPLH